LNAVAAISQLTLAFHRHLTGLIADLRAGEGRSLGGKPPAESCIISTLATAEIISEDSIFDQNACRRVVLAGKASLSADDFSQK